MSQMFSKQQGIILSIFLNEYLVFHKMIQMFQFSCIIEYLINYDYL